MSLNCSYLEMVKFSITQYRSSAMSIIGTLDFRSANFPLFKDLLGGFLWDRTLEDRGAQES